MAGILADLGSYAIFIILLIIVVVVIYWEHHLPITEQTQEEEEVDFEPDVPWVPYHESEELEMESEHKYALVPTESDHNEIAHNIDTLQSTTGVGVVHPVEHLASSRGSFFART